MLTVENTTKSVQSEKVNSNQSIGDLQNVRASYRLNGKNYLKWSQFVPTYLKRKGRVISLELDQNQKTHVLMRGMVMSWLWDSTDPEINSIYMILTSTKAIWDAVWQTYSKAQDTAQIFEIKVKVGALKQGSKSVTEYANLLQILW